MRKLNIVSESKTAVELELPVGVKIDIWDDGGATLDRYSIAFTGILNHRVKYTYFVGSSEKPFSPQGFWQHTTEIPTAEYRPKDFNHLGKRIKFSQLPTDVQKAINQELKEA